MRWSTNLLVALALAVLFSVPVAAQIGPFSAPGAGGQNATSSANAALLYQSTASPSGTASTTFVNLGLKANFNATYNGQVLVLVMFNHTSSVATDGGAVQCVWGTGAAPSNGGGPVGSVIGSTRTFTSGTTTATVEHGMCGGMVSVPTNTQVWFDVQFKAVTGGTYTLSNVDLIVDEIG